MVLSLIVSRFINISLNWVIHAKKNDFSTQCEKSAIKFLAEYDANICPGPGNDGVVSEIINQNFAEDEISGCILFSWKITNHRELTVSRLNFWRRVKIALFRT